MSFRSMAGEMKTLLKHRWIPSKVAVPRLIVLPKITDPRGNLTFLQNTDQVPFAIKRVFWTYDVPGGASREGHAYHAQKELIIALRGSFDVVVTHTSGHVKRFTLNRCYYGLYLPAMIWRHMENFSTNALVLHLVSHAFDENDYIREFKTYKRIAR